MQAKIFRLRANGSCAASTTATGSWEKQSKEYKDKPLIDRMRAILLRLQVAKVSTPSNTQAQVSKPEEDDDNASYIPDSLAAFIAKANDILEVSKANFLNSYPASPTKLTMAKYKQKVPMNEDSCRTLEEESVDVVLSSTELIPIMNEVFFSNGENLMASKPLFSDVQGLLFKDTNRAPGCSSQNLVPQSSKCGQHISLSAQETDPLAPPVPSSMPLEMTKRVDRLSRIPKPKVFYAQMNLVAWNKSTNKDPLPRSKAMPSLRSISTEAVGFTTKIPSPKFFSQKATSTSPAFIPLTTAPSSVKILSRPERNKHLVKKETGQFRAALAERVFNSPSSSRTLSAGDLSRRLRATTKKSFGYPHCYSHQPSVVKAKKRDETEKTQQDTFSATTAVSKSTNRLKSAIASERRAANTRRSNPRVHPGKSSSLRKVGKTPDRLLRETASSKAKVLFRRHEPSSVRKKNHAKTSNKIFRRQQTQQKLATFNSIQAYASDKSKQSTADDIALKIFRLRQLIQQYKCAGKQHSEKA
jgi:hypothetical protein